MKKVFLLLIAGSLSFSAVAQEEIPLFFDTKNASAPQSETPMEGAARTLVEAPAPNPGVRSGMPRIGRGATPRDSLVVPLPSTNVSIQLTDKPMPAPQLLPEQKPAPVAQQTNVITRDDPISMTENSQMSEALLDSLLVGTHFRQSPAARVPARVNHAFGERYDVRGFAISDVMLGMTAEEVIDAAAENGYSIQKITHAVPDKFRVFYEKECRAQPLYILSDITKCIGQTAQENGMYYVSKIHFAKVGTRESMTVLFTSDVTDNVAYKISYLSKGDSSLNFNRPNLEKKMERKNHFWRQVFETYGMPDDGKNLIWGDFYGAYLQAKMTGSAYDASLVLEDRRTPFADKEAIETEAGELPNPSPFTFSGSEGEY